MAKKQVNKKAAVLSLETLEARTLFAGAGDVVDSQVDIDVEDIDIDDLLGDDVVDSQVDIDAGDVDIDDLLADDGTQTTTTKSATLVKDKQIYTSGITAKKDPALAKALNGKNHDREGACSQSAHDRKHNERYKDLLAAGLIRDFSHKDGDAHFDKAAGEFFKDEFDWPHLIAWGQMAKYQKHKGPVNCF